jgi:hypothetical protein
VQVTIEIPGRAGGRTTAKSITSPVYCPETSGIYLLPIEDLAVRTNGALRVDPPRNDQQLRIRVTADYEIGRVAATAKPGGPAGA